MELKSGGHHRINKQDDNLDLIRQRLARTRLWQRIGGRGSRLYFEKLEGLLNGCETILDIGCGNNPQSMRLNTHKRLILCDAYYPTMQRINRGDANILCANVEALPFRQSIADGVLLLQVLEHLEKRKGQMVLEALDLIARKIVVISTPNGFVRQGDILGNPFQRHVSGWTAEELEGAGYTVMGCEGLKCFRKRETGEYRWPKCFFLLGVRIGLMEGLAVSHPKRAFQLLAYKKVGNG